VALGTQNKANAIAQAIVAKGDLTIDRLLAKGPLALADAFPAVGC